MQLDQDEIQNLKENLLYLIEKKHEQSGGNNGFSLNELKPILEELVKEEKVAIRPTINSQMYFKK